VEEFISHVPVLREQYWNYRPHPDSIIAMPTCGAVATERF